MRNGLAGIGLYLQEVLPGFCIRNALYHVLLFEMSARCRNVDTFKRKQIAPEGTLSLATKQVL